MADYKATGRQLAVAPETRGLPHGVWVAKQMVASKEEIAAHLNRESDRSKQIKEINQRKRS